MVQRSSLAAEERLWARLAHVDHFPPFAFVHQGRSDGLAIEILDSALSRVNMKASYLPANLDRVQVLVQEDQADGIAVFAVTPERQALYDFSEPFLITGGALFPRRAGPPAFDLDSYAGKTVCTPLKGPLTEFIRSGYPQIKFKTVQDYPSALGAVIQGEADAAALNIHVGTVLANELFAGKFWTPDKIFLESPLAVAALKARKGVMLGKISRGIAELKREQVYQSILLKWTDSAPIEETSGTEG